MKILWKWTVSEEFPQKFETRKLGEISVFFAVNNSKIPADNYMFKLTIETLEQGVKYVQSSNKDTRMTPMVINGKCAVLVLCTDPDPT